MTFELHDDPNPPQPTEAIRNSVVARARRRRFLTGVGAGAGVAVIVTVAALTFLHARPGGSLEVTTAEPGPAGSTVPVATTALTPADDAGSATTSSNPTSSTSPETTASLAAPTTTISSPVTSTTTGPNTADSAPDQALLVGTTDGRAANGFWPISIYLASDPNGVALYTTQPAADGTFSVAVPPGTYVAVHGAGVDLTCQSPPVTATPGATITLTFTCHGRTP